MCMMIHNDQWEVIVGKFQPIPTYFPNNIITFTILTEKWTTFVLRIRKCYYRTIEHLLNDHPKYRYSLFWMDHMTYFNIRLRIGCNYLFWLKF